MPTFTDPNALITSILARVTENHAQENTGARTQEVLVDMVYSLIEIIGGVPPSVIEQFPAWDADLVYEGGSEPIVKHDGKLYLFVSSSDDVGTEPGTDATKWKEISAVQLAHFRNEDQKLDAGGPNEVSAQEIREHLDAPDSPPTWSDVLQANAETGPNTPVVSPGQAIKYRQGSGATMKLQVQPLTTDQVQTFQDKSGVVATMDDVAASAQDLAGVLAQGNDTGPHDIRIAPTQRIVFRMAGGGTITLLAAPVIDPRVLSLPDKNGIVATTEDITSAVTPIQTMVDTHTAVLLGILATMDGSLKTPEAFSPSGDYPWTYAGEAVKRGDTFRLGAGTMGSVTVNAEDLLIALVDDPGQDNANWQVIESNRVVVSQVGIEDMLTSDNTSIVTPLRYWQGALRLLASPSFRSAVLGVNLAGYTPGTSAPIATTDSVLNAFRKLEAKADGKSNIGHTHLMSEVTNAGALATLNELPTLSAIFQQTGHPFNNGDIVYRTGFGNWAKAMAVNSLATHGYIYVQARINSNEFLGVICGRVTKTAGDLTTGVAFYLSDTVAGGITPTRPTTAGTYVVRLLMAQSGSEGFFFPSAPLPTTIANLDSTSQLGVSLLQDTTPQGMKARLSAFLSRSVSYSGSTILTVSNGGNAVNVTTGASNATLLLPDLSGEPEAGDGWVILVRKVDAGAGAVLTSPATMSLTRQGSSMLVFRSAGSWVVMPIDRFNEYSADVQAFLTASNRSAAMESLTRERDYSVLPGSPFTHTGTTAYTSVTGMSASAATSSL